MSDELEISERDRLLGEGAAAYLVFSAVSQYQIKASVAAANLDSSHPDFTTLIATAFALETAKKRSERFMNRLFTKLQGQDAADPAAVLKFMEEITNLSHLHLEAPLN